MGEPNNPCFKPNSPYIKWRTATTSTTVQPPNDDYFVLPFSGAICPSIVFNSGTNTWEHPQISLTEKNIFTCISEQYDPNPCIVEVDKYIRVADININIDRCKRYKLLLSGIITTTTSSPTTTTSTSTTTTVAPIIPELLLHFDGIDGSTTLINSGSNPLTVIANGSAAISTTNSKFGGSSVYLDGNSFLRTPSSSSFELRTGDFTVEAWINTLSSNEQTVVGMWDCDHAQFLMKVNNYQAMVMWVNSDVSFPVYYGGNITPGEWTHYALTRSGNNIRAFLNGVEVINFVGTTSGQPATTAIQIGREGDCYNANRFIGYIDEFRLIKGLAVYTSNFTPPTQPFNFVG